MMATTPPHPLTTVSISRWQNLAMQLARPARLCFKASFWLRLNACPAVFPIRGRGVADRQPSALHGWGTSAMNWHMTRLCKGWVRDGRGCVPDPSGSRGGANLLGPQTRSLLIVIVKRFAARSLASVALLDMLGPMLAHAGVRGGRNHRADFAHSVASLASRGHDLSPNIR